MNGDKSLCKIRNDFYRDVWCLFGLPIDSLTLEETCKILKQKIQSNKKTVLSTVNINWLITSLHNPDFRSAIISSDICVLDGVPLLWFAKLFGLPFKEVVPGSSLIQSIKEQLFDTNPVSIYFFGGDDGIGKKASDKLNRNGKGLTPVGFLNPGFGSLEELEKEEFTGEINDTHPDILLVSLGALKGQLWIESNKEKLNAKVISHLGATINFIAGTVKRAPLWMQKLGIEWIWRILEEPNLFKRYLKDGIAAIPLIVKNFYNYFYYNQMKFIWNKHGKRNQPYISFKETIHTITINPNNECCACNHNSVKKTFCLAAIKKRDIVVDFINVKFVDNRFLGSLLILLKHQKINRKSLKLINVNKRLERILRLNLFDYTLNSLRFPLWEKPK